MAKKRKKKGSEKMAPKEVLSHLLVWFDQLPDHRMGPCRIVEKDHEDDPRVFAHVFHRKGHHICVCREFIDLPLGHQIGILLHEIGHLMSDSGEAEADLWVQDFLDIDIEFKNTLQWVDPKEVGL